MNPYRCRRGGKPPTVKNNACPPRRVVPGNRRRTVEPQAALSAYGESGWQAARARRWWCGRCWGRRGNKAGKCAAGVAGNGQRRWLATHRKGKPKGHNGGERGVANRCYWGCVCCRRQPEPCSLELNPRTQWLKAERINRSGKGVNGAVSANQVI